MSTAHGEAAWDATVEHAGVVGAYTTLGDYPDDELLRLVAAGSHLLDVPPDELTTGIGSSSTAALAAAHLTMFSPHRDVRSFLLTLNEVIHPEVRKLHPGAVPPRFFFTPSPDGGLRVEYHSTRRLCALAVGMVRGAAAHYGQTVEVTRPQCRRRGDEVCVLECRFDPSGPS